MSFRSIDHLLDAGREMPLWRAVLEDDCRERGVAQTDSMERMEGLWRAMGQSVDDYRADRRSPSGLSGGQGAKMAAAANPLCGSFLQSVIATALKVGEHNACMGRIVAAPTAGASGVLPAVLLPVQAKYALSDEEILRALYVSAGFGQVIAARATLAGAEGGCQAEVGAASAMASAALCHLKGGTPEQCAAAAAMALGNLLGLVCDPVAGLVEVPCVKRNVVGAVNAVSCANMALAGVNYAIPCDEVIDAMRSVGDALPTALRETGAGGLAATPTGHQVAEAMRGGGLGEE